jgi:hypothetical protein
MMEPVKMRMMNTRSLALVGMPSGGASIGRAMRAGQGGGAW